MKYIGNIFSSDGVKINPEKVEAITKTAMCARCNTTQTIFRYDNLYDKILTKFGN